MKKRDYYISFILALLVSYAAYYRSQTHANNNEIAKEKQRLDAIQRSGIISIKPTSAYNDSTLTSEKNNTDKPST